MATTVLFVELLVVGIQGLAVIFSILLALLGTNWTMPEIRGFPREGWAVVVVALAYSLGVTLDRLFDMASEGIWGSLLDRLLRGKYNSRWRKCEVERMFQESLKNCAWVKAQSKVEGVGWDSSKASYVVLHMSEGLGFIYAYFRGRVRIARALFFNSTFALIPVTIVAVRVGGPWGFLAFFLLGLLALLALVAWLELNSVYYRRMAQAVLVIESSQTQAK